jgi:hypothetical protein
MELNFKIQAFKGKNFIIILNCLAFIFIAKNDINLENDLCSLNKPYPFIFYFLQEE